LSSENYFWLAAIAFVAWLAWQRRIWQLLTPARYYSFMEEIVRLAPVSAIYRAWKKALGLPRRSPALFGLTLLLFACPPILDYLTDRVVKLDDNKLLAIGFSWQAFGAACLAVLAVRLHRISGDRGQEPVSLRLSLMSAAWGIGLWAFMTLTGIALSYAAPQLPIGLASLAVWLDRYIPQVLFVLIVFIRPALSLGDAKPWLASYRAVLSKPVATLVWISMLSAPLALFRVGFGQLIYQYWNVPPDWAIWSYQAAVSLFNAFNFSAFEMSTAIMFMNLKLKWRVIVDF